MMQSADSLKHWSFLPRSSLWTAGWSRCCRPGNSSDPEQEAERVFRFLNMKDWCDDDEQREQAGYLQHSHSWEDTRLPRLNTETKTKRRKTLRGGSKVIRRSCFYSPTLHIISTLHTGGSWTPPGNKCFAVELSLWNKEGWYLWSGEGPCATFNSQQRSIYRKIPLNNYFKFKPFGNWNIKYVL